MIRCQSDHCASTLSKVSPVPLIDSDPIYLGSRITDPDPNHPKKGNQYDHPVIRLMANVGNEESNCLQIVLFLRSSVLCVLDRTRLYMTSFCMNQLFSHLLAGKYMYIETSSPRQYGDNAKLDYSVSSSDIGKLSCLTFYYHMYGSTINTLTVFNGNTRVFTMSGNQGSEWFKTKVTMSLKNKVSCIYRHTRDVHYVQLRHKTN